MALTFNDFIQDELPKRPFTEADGSAGQVLVRSSRPERPRELEWADLPGLDAGLRLVAHTDISGHRAVMATPLGAEHADPANAGAVIGISKHAAAAGDLVGIATQGTLTEPTWAWTPGATVFFVADGLLTQTVPTAVSVMPIGTALTPTSILINPLHAVFLGA